MAATAPAPGTASGPRAALLTPSAEHMHIGGLDVYYEYQPNGFMCVHVGTQGAAPAPELLLADHGEAASATLSLHFRTAVSLQVTLQPQTLQGPAGAAERRPHRQPYFETSVCAARLHAGRAGGRDLARGQLPRLGLPRPVVAAARGAPGRGGGGGSGSLAGVARVLAPPERRRQP